MTFIWKDPDDDKTYEMRYVVTQGAHEGPEYVEWRVKPDVETTGKAYEVKWHRLPPWAMPPQEALDYWHGPLITSFNENQEGTILAMRDESELALCLNFYADAELFFADLTEYIAVSNPDGDEVKPGDIIKVDNAKPVDMQALREWVLG